MSTADEIKILNHILTDRENHPECVLLSPEEIETVLMEYDQTDDRLCQPAPDEARQTLFCK